MAASFDPSTLRWFTVDNVFAIEPVPLPMSWAGEDAIQFLCGPVIQDGSVQAAGVVAPSREERCVQAENVVYPVEQIREAKLANCKARFAASGGKVHLPGHQLPEPVFENAVHFR